VFVTVPGTAAFDGILPVKTMTAEEPTGRLGRVH